MEVRSKMRRKIKDTLVQVKVARRERERWAAAATEDDHSLSELVREAVRERVRQVLGEHEGRPRARAKLAG